MARIEPARIRAKATAIVVVRCSSRRTVPAATATAGFTYVMTVARVGPASLISSRKATNAIAVQTTPRAARDSRTSVEGSVEGAVISAAGAYTTAASARHGAVRWRDGTSRRWRAAIKGAVA
ncbi:hypothetical protein VSS16_00150 [Streptomyces broussonetiae]|uniref:Uncharacterized protein n=1 Tax=Streptomyces broussonetiae TaxID=2686304 RepID=A0ABV5E2W6_9ACTN